MRRVLKVLLVVVTGAISCLAQEGDDGWLILPFFRKLESAFHSPAKAVDSNGLPVFQPALVRRRGSKEPNRPQQASPAGAVTLTTEQYVALYSLAAQAQAAPNLDTSAQPAADNSPAATDEAPPPAVSTLRVALPATAAVTRPPKPTAGSAGSPPLRRKQQ